MLVPSALPLLNRHLRLGHACVVDHSKLSVISTRLMGERKRRRNTLKKEKKKERERKKKREKKERQIPVPYSSKLYIPGTNYHLLAAQNY